MEKSKFQISDAVGSCGEAQSIQINEMVYELRRARKPVTVLSLGEAFFDIPMFDFSGIDFNQSYHYSDSQGIPRLRNRIAAYYSDRYEVEVDGRTEILITAGSKAAIFMAMLTALNPGDEVAVHEPCWLSYPQQAHLCGIKPIHIPYHVAPADFGTYFTSRTKMMILNNPNNPSGRVYSRDEIIAIHEQCEKRGIYLLSDEAYSDFVTDNSFLSVGKVISDKTGVIIVNSLSKNLGISGWRIGYVIAAAPFIRQMLKSNQHIVTCAPTLLLNYCDVYFDRLLEVTKPQVKAVVEKRNRVASMMDTLGIRHMAGSATFYLFADIGNFPGTSQDYAMHLLASHAIAVVPGSAYGNSTDRFVRLSIGVESEEAILSALKKMKELSSVNEFTPYDYMAEHMKKLQLS